MVGEERGPSLPSSGRLGRIGSALPSPVLRAAAKPSPISTPFTALIPIIAWASSASSLA
jgi:hypothetical protein